MRTDARGGENRRGLLLAIAWILAVGVASTSFAEGLPETRLQDVRIADKQSPRVAPIRSGVGVGAQRISPAAPGPGGSSSNLQGTGETVVELDWYWAAYGNYIGAAGLVVADLDADGDPELVASAGGIGGSGSAGYWYVLDGASDEYFQEWVSLPFDPGVDRLEVAQVDDDAALEFVVAAGNNLFVYDSQSFELERQIQLETSGLTGLVVGQMDGDEAMEVAVCSGNGTWSYDLETLVEEFHLPDRPCADLAVGETDGTPGRELVVANGSFGWVLDSATGALEWSHGLGFGIDVAVADFDSDGLEEIAAGFELEGVQVWHGDTQSFFWEHKADQFVAMTAADVDGDGTPELVTGDFGTDLIEVLSGATGESLWTIENPGYGVTGIAVGDVDADGAREIFFGIDSEPSGDRLFFAVDSKTREIEWSTHDDQGPFLGFSHGDVDADEEHELLFTSVRSRSFYGDGLYFVHDARTFELEFRSPEPTGSNVSGLWTLQVAEIDSDPALEIFLGTGRYNDEGVLQCRDGVQHGLQWTSDLGSGLIVSSMKVGDLDGDGSLEVVVGGQAANSQSSGPRVLVHEAATGAFVWQSPSLASFFGFISSLEFLRIANIDSDPTLEVVVAEELDGVLGLDSEAGTIDLAYPSDHTTALAVADLDGDGIEEVLIGDQVGSIQLLNPEDGTATLLAGPFVGPIRGLAVQDVVGSPAKDLVFVSADSVHLVDGETFVVIWQSGDIGEEVGRWDGLAVDDFRGDGGMEIWVSTGRVGHMLFSIRTRLFSDGFETGDYDQWSTVVP